jgi:cyanate permease
MTLVFTFWFFESEPAQPPSAAEAARRRHQASHEASSSSSSSSLYTDVKRLLQDKDYLVILYAFGVGLAIFNAILTLFPEWIATAGFDDPDVAGNCGGLLVVGGMLSTAVAAPLLDHSRQYTTAVRVSFAVALVVSTGTVWMLRPSTSTRMLGLAFAALGAAQLPLLTICLDAVAAHTYPISEEVSSEVLDSVATFQRKMKIETHRRSFGNHHRRVMDPDIALVPIDEVILPQSLEPHLVRLPRLDR